jgi:hypothetical protein
VAVPQAIVDLLAAIIVIVAVLGYIFNLFGWPFSLVLFAVSGVLYFNQKARNTLAQIIENFLH